MTYENATEELTRISNLGSKPGLERINKLLNMINNPQNSLKCIHVAGTNGKGSVCFILSSIFKEAGYKTGTFISPHIEDFRERIQINGQLISKDKVCEILDYLNFYLNREIFTNDPVTEFELTTAMAFKYFKDENCDIVILETGMGGRLDATNVIKNPLCSVITTVSLDHVKILGKTVLEIAKEKFGIIKSNSLVVIGNNQKSEVYELAKNICKEKKSKLIIAQKEKITGINKYFPNKNSHLNMHLCSEYQKDNLSTALSVIENLRDTFNISSESIIKGLKNVNLPCRMEVINNSPLVILDAAHNVEGARALVNFIETNLDPKNNIVGIIGMFSDKDVEGVIKTVSNHFSKIITIKSDSSRAMTLDKITYIAKKYNNEVCFYEKISDAIEKTIPYLSQRDTVIVFGSFSIMKKCKKIIKNFFIS